MRAMKDLIIQMYKHFQVVKKKKDDHCHPFLALKDSNINSLDSDTCFFLPECHP